MSKADAVLFTKRLNGSPVDGEARFRRVRRVAFWLAAGIVALLLVGWWLSRPPRPDAFYDPPIHAGAAPGTLLRSQAFTRGVPAGARAWRILYATTRTNGSPAVASAIVMTSVHPSPGRHPVIAWAHGTTGIAAGCAPSLLAAPFANVPALEELVDHDWVYVASDYAGMGTAGGHAYLVGDDAARGVLDAVRAARHLRALAIDGRTVVWGHSQGGAGVLWTGMRAAAYAPDVPLAGIAAIAPASNLPALLERNQGSIFGKMVSAYMIRAYAATYPDVDEAAYVSPALRPLVGDVAGRCISLFSALEAATLLPRDGIFSRSPAAGPLGRRLRENVPNGPIAAPLLIAQGLADKVVLPDIQRAYVARRCVAGQKIDYRTYGGRDHLTILTSESPFIADLVTWTEDRLAGRPPTSTCSRRGR